MSLTDHVIKQEYRSLIDNVIQGFYIPLLSDAILYQRAVGFFSSSALVEISKGIATLAKNGGKIQIVASPYLSEDDIAAIQKGYESRNTVIENALLAQLSEEELDYYSMERLNLLANLIADGILDIKIAYTEDNSCIGMYHEKMGIITDNSGNKVAFSGSMNESSTAMSINYETIDVFRSWGDDFESNHVKLKENAFSSIWNNTEPSIHVLEFPRISQALIEKYKRKPANYDVDHEQFKKVAQRNVSNNTSFSRNGARIPADIILHDYQKEAIASWVAENYRGIFDMATGTGKTLTGLGAIAKLSEDLGDELAVIIVCPYQHLVEQWVEDIVKFNMSPIIGFSRSSQKDWKKRLEDAVRDQKLNVTGKEFFCFICTNATFRSDFVQKQLMKIRSSKLLVVDEAHNFGAEYLSCLLNDSYDYRLGLSATIERHGDKLGTSKLFSFFGKKCIEYPLDRAIAEHKLTEYMYYPVVVKLDYNELAAYDNLTFEIAKCIIKGKDGKIKLNERGKTLALQRARIVAGASGKLAALEKEIMPYKEEKHILVYCGATKGLQRDEDSTNIDDDDLRQIDVVTDLLGNKLGMEVSQFTSKEDIEEREVLKREFTLGDTLKVLIAIKCLDEGVNIPMIKTAFILASTTNPKEYIQRRGRVLRLAKGKEYAEIYDFITLPYFPDEVSSLTEQQLKRNLTLVKNELVRAEEFSRLANNAVESQHIIDEIKDAYGIHDIQSILLEEDAINEW